MRLWLDAQALQGPFYERGIARYVRGVATALEAQGAPIAGFGFNPSQSPPRDAHSAVRDSRFARQASAANLREAAHQNDLVYVSGSAFEGYVPLQNLWPNFTVIPQVPAAAIVYDTIPFRRPNDFQATHERRQFYAARRHLLERADAYLAISESTANELRHDVDVGNRPISVIGCGVDDRFVPAADPEHAWKVASDGVLGLRPSFLYYVGGFQPQKNVMGLIEAFALLPPAVRADLQLVIGGSVPDVQRRDWEAGAARHCVDGSVIFTGMVTDEVLIALCQMARLAVVPSLHEGFGLPAAEAIACGTPAITSNTSSLPEVVGWVPATFDPSNPESIASLIERSLTDTEFDAELQTACDRAAPRHRWSAVAQRLLRAVEPLAPGALRRGPSRGLRIAIIARSAARPAVEALREVQARLPTATVDVFLNDRADFGPEPGLFPLRGLSRTMEPSLYDLVVDTATETVSVGCGPTRENIVADVIRRAALVCR